MPHITFIHGISNKPAKERLIQIWLRALEGAGGIDLGSNGVTCSMVYWADVMYGEPLPETTLESTLDLENNAIIAGQTAADPDMSWRERTVGEEKEFVDDLAAKLTFDALVDDTFTPAEAQMDSTLERIPVPWFIKRRIMKEFLRDVHHYLFNETHAPKPGVSFQVQEEIRRRTIQELQQGTAKGRPHIIVSHSMGTVIAYDCLKRVGGCPVVDGLMTVGSPLGIDEVQDKLKPEWSRGDGFPSQTVRGAWVNVYDSLDPVTGFDGDIANDFKRAAAEVIQVINEQNWGVWRHSITNYLRGPKLRASLGQLLEL